MKNNKKHFYASGSDNDRYHEETMDFESSCDYRFSENGEDFDHVGDPRDFEECSGYLFEKNTIFLNGYEYEKSFPDPADYFDDTSSIGNELTKEFAEDCDDILTKDEIKRDPDVDPNLEIDGCCKDDLHDDALLEAAIGKLTKDANEEKEESPQGKKRIPVHTLASILAATNNIALFDGTPHIYDSTYRIYRPLLSGNDSTLLRSIVPEEHRAVLSCSSLRDVIEWLKVDENVMVVTDSDIKDREQLMVNFANTAIWADTLKPAHAGKKQFFRRYIHADYPVDYVPEGYYFTKYLADTFGDDVQAVRLFQEVLGYVLGDYRGAKKAFLFFGPSNTGKSVAGNFMRQLVGDEFTSSLTLSDLNTQFGAARLYGKYLNIGSEIDTSSRASGSLFKRLVGNDEVSADVKFLPGIDFVNTAAMVFLANSFPRFSVGENAGSIAERFVIVPFLNPIARKDWIQDLSEKIFAEADYVVQFAMEGLCRLKKNNYQFSYCQTAERLMNEYMVQAFPENQFIKKLLVADPDGKIATAELDARYRSFCVHYDLPCPGKVAWFPVLSEEFSVKRIRGIRYEDNRDSRGFSGISFK